MPKRRIEDKIERYNRKLRRLEEKQNRRRYRIIASSDSEEKSDDEPQCIDDVTTPVDPVPVTSEVGLPDDHNSESTQMNIQADQEPTLPDLDPDIISALGESTEEAPKYGEKIHDNLSHLWTPILRKGLTKDVKDKLLKQYLIPENCTLLRAPKLNPEISAAVSDATRGRDKRVEAIQDQLGLGITAINRGLSFLLESDKDKLQAIKYIGDGCRILSDLHFAETQTRIKFVTTGLDKSFLNVIQEIDRDETLFGNKLSDKIKASKAIEKQSLQIKKLAPISKTPSVPATNSTVRRPRAQGNWTAPPRYPSNRGGRGGAKRSADHRRVDTTHQRQATHNKQRARTQH